MEARRTHTDPTRSYAYRLGQAEVHIDALVAERDELRALLSRVVDVIEDYCEDHNSDRPTDVTVLLPELKVRTGYQPTADLTARSEVM